MDNLIKTSPLIISLKCDFCSRTFSKYRSSISTKKTYCSHSCTCKSTWQNGSLRERKLSEETRRKMSLARIGKFLNEKHPAWKGDKVSYSGLHKWVGRKLGKAKACQQCGANDSKNYDWANKSGLYLRILSDWIELCRKCHVHYDDIYAKRRMNKTWT